MGAGFPLAGVAVAELAEALGIVAPRPVAVVMPNDDRLGQFRAMFAGRVGLLSVHADEREGERAGFGGYTKIINSDSLYLELRTAPGNSVDDRYFLRARLLDALVGDWDRHSGQWRWGRRTRGDSVVWRAIPEDRDWAFSRIDGMVGWGSRWLLPRYVGFSDRFPPASRLVKSVDYRLLNRLERFEFLDVVNEVRSQLTDSVLAKAVETLPGPYLELERERLLTALKARRDHLSEYGEDFYRAVARTVYVRGFDGTQDQVEFQRISKERVRVILRSGGATGPIRFERMLDGRETRTVKLFIDSAQDQVVGNKDLPFKVEILPPADPG